MNLIGIKLKNFRGYKDIYIHLQENLQMIVGMNDIGKSTILEALDIFFNDKNATVKISKDDLNISMVDIDNVIEIACLFSIEEMDTIVIDSSYRVFPRDEYLLNAEGYFEIIKKWDTSLSALKATTYIKCAIPSCIDVNILTKKQNELKALLNTLDPSSNVNKTINSEMRRAIYDKLLVLNGINNKEERIIETKAILSDKDFYPNLEKQFPAYYLFKADRKNTTTDDEVQNPLNIAVKHAFENEQVKDRIAEIEDIIVSELKEINVATIEQMSKFSMRLGSSLIPKITPTWTKAISNDILDSNDIPINKKGSGIRRLLLLSYLMVEANKTSFENGKKNIIYAVEEPETSLHPNLQKKFISELIRMANTHDYISGNEIPSNIDSLNKYKIIITTHLPNYIAYAKPEELIYISEDDNGNVVQLSDEDEYERIQSEMGLLPNPKYGYVIFVEGESDEWFLRNVAKIPDIKSIFDINRDNVDVIPLRGSNLLKSIEKDFYKDMPIKQFHLYDGDREDYKQFLVEKVNGKNKKWKGVTTIRKEIEYYIPFPLIETNFGIDLLRFKDMLNDASFDLVKTLLSIPSTNDILCGIKKNKSLDTQETALKNYLNKTIMKGISKELLEAHGVYDEVKGWFEQMKILDTISE